MRTEVDLGGVARAMVIDRRTDRSQRARISENAPHAHYAVDRDDIKAELGAFVALASGIGVQRDMTVWEPFGGSGWHAAIIQALIRPKLHVANDISADCIESIRASCPGARAFEHDSFKGLRLRTFGTFDWVHADFNLWTLKRMADDDHVRLAFHGMFASARTLITFTDTTPYHINGGVEGDDCLRRLGWYQELRLWLQAMFGWTIESTWEWGPAAMHLVRPGAKSGYTINGPFPPMPVTVLSQTDE